MASVQIVIVLENIRLHHLLLLRRSVAPYPTCHCWMTSLSDCHSHARYRVQDGRP